MEDMKMKGYKKERQQGRRDIKEARKGKKTNKNKERRQSHPPASPERVGQGKWEGSHRYGSC